jgi:hypothetical protein
MKTHHMIIQFLVCVYSVVMAQAPVGVVAPAASTAAPVPPQTPAPAKPLSPVRHRDYIKGIAAVPANNYVRWAPQGQDTPISIIAFKSSDQKVVDEATEDLKILSLILSQNVERALTSESADAAEFKLGIPMLLKTGGHAVEATWLEGFGAVFNLKVRFPLVPPASEAKESESNRRDSEWEQARNAITGANQRPGYLRPMTSQREERYNQKLVETLKRRVLQVLKNASNLRHVKSGEWLVVTFSGPGSTSSEQVNDGEQSADVQPEIVGGRVKVVPVPVDELGQPMPPQRLTVMTIRIKKENADAFAANKISEEEFFQAAEVTTYLGPSVPNDGMLNYFRSAR